jgi:hypothetical protein
MTPKTGTEKPASARTIERSFVSARTESPSSAELLRGFRRELGPFDPLERFRARGNPRGIREGMRRRNRRSDPVSRPPRDGGAGHTGAEGELLTRELIEDR